MTRPTLGSIPRESLIERLGLLRTGFARVMELSSAWVASEPRTQRKIALGELIGHAACSAELIGQRMREVQAPARSYVLYQPSFLEHSNRTIHVESGAERWDALLSVLGALQAAGRLLLQEAPSQSDALTEWAIDPALRRIDAWARVWQDSPIADASPELSRAWFEPAVPSVGPEAGVDPGPWVNQPAREEGLVVMETCPAPRSVPIFIHNTIFNIEICAVEVCARILAEHPDAPWGLKLALARQIFDEAKHALSLSGRLAELGGRLGDHPIDMRVFRAFRGAESLPEKLMIQHRIGEGGGLDGGALVVEGALREGDRRTAALFEYINADEVNHVRNGNHWIRELLRHDEAKIARLEAAARDRILSARADRRPLPPWVEGRKLAGFTRSEVEASVERFRATSGHGGVTAQATVPQL